MITLWKYCLAAVVALAMIMATADVARAQRRDRGGMRMGNVAAVQLLLVDKVQADLKLTDEQKKKVAGIHEEFITVRREIISTVPKESGERGGKIKELKKKTDATLNEALDETQRGRLKQVVLQVNGAAELEDEAVAAQLKITDEQKKKLAEVRKANNKARREAMKALEEGVVDGRSQKLLELQQEGDKRLLEVLTPEQQKQFAEMQGEKLELDLFKA